MGDTKPPAPAGAMRQPPHACHPRCEAGPLAAALGRRPRSEGDMRAELGRGRVGGVRGALTLTLKNVTLTFNEHLSLNWLKPLKPLRPNYLTTYLTEPT